MPLGKLPKSARKVWESVYNESIKSSCKGDKACAAQSAWSAVKSAGWKKQKDGNWVKKSALIEFDMHITKASFNNNEMRWAAVNSDTAKDSYEERMSLELYADFDKYIKGEKELPQEMKSLFYSEYWKGGMPYLSISHYPDLGGKAVPGEPKEVFVDGNRLKAKGILFDSPLGHSVYRSLKNDENVKPEEKIRISIGFLDLAHKHGEHGNVWVRESAYSLCPECLQGIREKVYLQGCLIHLALTRSPVNKRTEMVLEERSMTKKKTRKEDAESIVGKELADVIDAENRTSVQRSDILVEMSETEEETQELIAEVEASEEVSEDTEVVGEVSTEVKSEVDVEKSEDDVMADALSEPVAYAENLPYGGATSMKDAENYVAAKNEAIYLMDMWSVFSNVVWNIMDRSDIMDKRAALNSAVDEFKNVLTAKAMVAFSVTEKSEVEVIKTHELQPAIDALLEKVDNSIGLEDVQKAELLNPALQELGVSITDYLTSKSVAEEPPAQIENENTLLKNIEKMLQPIAESVSQIGDRVGVLEAKSQAQIVEAKPRIPQPRTLPSNLVQKSVPEQPKKGSLKDIARKSVGLQ